MKDEWSGFESLFAVFLGGRDAELGGEGFPKPLVAG